MHKTAIELKRQTIRKAIRDKRRELSDGDQRQASRRLLKQLCLHPQIKRAKSLAVYLANDGELDLTLFIEWCWQQNKSIYLPVIHPFSRGNLLFLRYDRTTEMTTNSYGILEPKLDVRNLIVVNELDILCTPLVAFDDKGNRLGMGGGFYDRTLDTWYQKSLASNLVNKPFPIGIAHDCQQVQLIPYQQWDIPLPQIITPQQILTLQN